MKATDKTRLRRIYNGLETLHDDLGAFILALQENGDVNERQLADMEACADAIEKALDEIKLIVEGK